jgi:ArsR family transcriptional regulator, cadmium/lead-responsive transcriptional repressor
VTARSAISPTLLSTLFRGLADPARLSCLLAVRERPRTVNEVVAQTRLSQPNVSKHLACLRDCGLVRAERSGRFVSYQLAHAQVEVLLQATEALLLEVGEQIAACPNYGKREEHPQ